MSLRPLIAICGTTGVGKSKLAIELAQALSQSKYGINGYHGARIINADAMQVYAGMDIITNKVPLEEQAGVEHLLMGYKKPGEQYVVGQWVKDAIEAIEETHRRNQVPIIVGGTSYWIQHLIFPNRLASLERLNEKDERPPAPMSETLATAVNALSQKSSELYHDLPKQLSSDYTDADSASALYSLLSSLDPQMAQRWHWKDSRKVLRSLNIIKESGRLGSELVSEQNQVNDPPRYRSLLLWLYANPELLFPRLDSRVDVMIERGLLQEVQELIDLAKSPPEVDASETNGEEPKFDYTLGLYQSIGFKEFSQYLAMPDSPEKEKIYAAAVERMKLSTRQYAKKQVSWLRNKLLPAANSVNAASQSAGELPVIPAYLLDATDLSTWDTSIRNKAEHIMEDFLSERELPNPLSTSETAATLLSLPEKDVSPAAVLNARRKIICPICTVNPEQPMMVEEGKEWNAHVGTRFHRKMQRRAEHGHEWEARKKQRIAAEAREREVVDDVGPNQEVDDQRNNSSD
ncbi:hypothetical protein QCA50_002703 [Cerrena zonata]|uniref:tRNA isopentenyltransferase n=1 Tax=Cerrena zonata TaxID=2478898 RepID=A0AAW0GMJ6_9APHY